jgi:hypothetical protein
MPEISRFFGIIIWELARQQAELAMIEPLE